MGVILLDKLGGQIWQFLHFLIYLRFGWTNMEIFWCSDSGKIFDQYDPQNVLETVEAGAKKSIFLPILLLLSQNFGASEL